MSVAVLGLSLVAVSGGSSLVVMPGFSSQWLLLCWCTGSSVHGLSSTGPQSLSCPAVTWDLPIPGIEPVSPALQGGFLTTGPPRKPEIVSDDRATS